uniref:BHLH domain-containing protein n=1 Tax=Lutzomyia longipalpis TaxID=7200 RepID=A0A1B0CA58_LUTLO
MTKKSSPRNREWEKDRRDRLNKTFDSLAKKLPQYDPSSPFSKIEILQKTIAFIEELQEKQNELMLSACDKVLLKEREEFEQNIAVLRCRNSQLAELLRQANITIPIFKAQQFAKDLTEKRIESLQEENNANGINIKPEKQKKYSNKLSSEQITKAVKENGEKAVAKKSSRGKTSSPKRGSNTGCLSPTAAFLMTFPVVSSAGGKNPESALAEESPTNSGNVGNQAEGGKEDQEAENSSALLENLSSFFGGRDDYPGLYPAENLEKVPQKIPEKAPPEGVSNSIRIRTDMGPQKPSMEAQTPASYSESFSTFDYSFTNSCTSKINSSVFPSYTSMPFLPDVPPPPSVNPTKSEFTFSLTKTTTTAPCTTYKADSLYNPFSFAATSTHNSVINSSCHPVPPPPDGNLGLPLPLNIYPNVSEDATKGQGSFTFSLTNTTSAQSYYTKAPTNLNISFPANDTYNTYNPFSYNDPVGIKQTNDISTNFSFCLTSSAPKNTPIYTSTSTYNTLNPFSIDATLQSSNYRQQNYENPTKNYQFYPSQGQKQAHKSQSKGYPKDQGRSQTAQKSPPKKNQNQQSKYHNVNWMTNSDCHQVKTNDFHIPPPLDFTHTTNASTSFTYPPPPPPALGGSIDLKSKSDVFFAHPPDENFSWSPNKLSNVLEPPTLHNYMPQATLPTLHGDLALSTTSATQEVVKEKTPPQNLENYQDHHQSGGNFLSVSQLLVEQNKKGKKPKNSKNTDDPSRKPLKDKKQFQCMNPPGSYADQGITYPDNNNKGSQQYSNIYSAENLIGCNRKEKGVPQNYHQAPLDLPPAPPGGNLFPSIDLNTDYNTNILFNPPTSTTFVPPPQNCMSVFPENDFYDYSNKAGSVPKVGQQQNSSYYFNKPPHQNTLPPMDYTKGGDMKSSPSYAGNKFNAQTPGAKAKKAPSAKIPDFYPPPPIHSNINYDSSVPSSNYFSVPLGVNSPHLPPGDDPFHLHLNYSSTLKNLTPGNSSSLYLPEGPNVSNTTNSHTNFHLSSICPEINDKVRQQD